MKYSCILAQMYSDEVRNETIRCIIKYIIRQLENKILSVLMSTVYNTIYVSRFTLHYLHEAAKNWDILVRLDNQ